MIRRKLIAGNWKMNKTAAEGVSLAQDIVAAAGKEPSVDVVLCPPFTALESVSRVLEGQAVKLGAQNMHPERSGAFTGEVSAEMLRTLYVTHVILGHSERRTLFGETDDFINRKVVVALAHQMKPILCVGETLAERDAGTTLAVVQRQVEACLRGVKPDQITTVIIAYEPVWAIGTGKTATPEIAEETHEFCRSILAEHFGKRASSSMPILYGGSVKPENTAALMQEKDINGALVGGASLEAKTFSQIVNYR